MDIDDAVEMLKNYPKFHKYLMNLFLKDQILSDQFCVLRDTRDIPEPGASAGQPQAGGRYIIQFTCALWP